jgi:hypothetical protein
MPPNGHAPACDRGNAQFNNLVPDNGVNPAPAQEHESLQVVWTREAWRLAGQFSLTGDWRHFTALVPSCSRNVLAHESLPAPLAQQEREKALP